MRNGLVVLVCSLALSAGAAMTAAAPAVVVPEQASAESIDALIAGLGDDDYNRRESAAAALKALGPAAVDALLAAAEMHDDLEVSLRARWLVDAIPLQLPHDPPAVAKLLERFKRRDVAERIQGMHRLLRVDDDAGIEPLARVARLETSAAGSRVAAALLAREWQPDEPAWPGLRPRISAGLGTSSRPAARFLAALVRFTGDATGEATAEATADATAEAQAESLAAASAALADLAHPNPDAPSAAGEDIEALAGETQRIFTLCHVQMLLAAERRDEAVAAVRNLLAEHDLADSDPDEIASACVATLTWAVEHGVPEVVDMLVAKEGFVQAHPLVGHAAAFAEQARGNLARAEQFTAEALESTKRKFAERLQAAIMLAKWGCVDWATRAYRSLIDDPATPSAELALASIMYAEFLHDLERDDEAAHCLRRLFDGPGADDEQDGKKRKAAPGPLLEQIGRDPRETRSRMHFFEACAAAQRGDAAARRQAVVQALASHSKDVDALIAAYTLPDNTPEQRAETVARIKAALELIESEIQAVPDDANGYNEYAWLVANTEGDVQKALRYSKLSLVKSFDNSSYLDTLAHCRAAAGDSEGAVRTQLLARRHEPHNRTIQRNLERFQKLAQ